MKRIWDGIFRERRISVLVVPCLVSLVLSAFILTAVVTVRPLYGVRMAIAAVGISAVWMALLILDFRRMTKGRTKRTMLCSPLTVLVPAVFLGIYLAHAVWGSRYLTLAPLEQIDNGVQHLDALFHSSLAESFKRSLIPSTLLNGETYIPYHSFSHLLMSVPSRILGAPALVTYCYMYPALFLPAYLLVQMMAMVSAKEYFCNRSKLRLRDWSLLVLYNVGCLPDAWLDEHGIWKRNCILSESFLIAGLLAFLSYAVILHVMKYPGKGLKRMKILLLAVIPVSIFVITWCKISTGLVFAATVMYTVFRKKIRDIRFWGLNVLYGVLFLLAAWLFNFMEGGYQSTHNAFRFAAFSPYCPGPLGLLGHYGFLMMMPARFIALEIRRLRKERQVFSTGKTVWIEVALLAAFVSFAPGFVMAFESGSAVYFSYMVEIPAILLLAGQPSFSSERRIPLTLRRGMCVVCAVWCTVMCWINRASDPMKYVTGQHESNLSAVLMEIREKCGGHPQDYTIYLEEDNIAQQVFKPVILKDLRTAYVWPAMTGVGVINATYEENGTIYSYTGEVLPTDYGAQYTDAEHPLSLEEAKAAARQMGKKEIIVVGTGAPQWIVVSE